MALPELGREPLQGPDLLVGQVDLADQAFAQLT